MWRTFHETPKLDLALRVFPCVHCAGLYLDAQAAFDFLLKRTDIDHRRIIIFGRSLGGAVAVHLAGEPFYAQRALCLVVENTFTTLPHIARHLFGSFRIIAYLPRWCYKNKVGSLIISSESDGEVWWRWKGGVKCFYSMGRCHTF